MVAARQDLAVSANRSTKPGTPHSGRDLGARAPDRRSVPRRAGVAVSIVTMAADHQHWFERRAEVTDA